MACLLGCADGFEPALHLRRRWFGAINDRFGSLMDDTFGLNSFGIAGHVANRNARNFAAGRAAANGTQVSLSSQGQICVYANVDAQVIVDVNGWWG